LVEHAFCAESKFREHPQSALKQCLVPPGGPVPTDLFADSSDTAKAAFPRAIVANSLCALLMTRHAL
jgi:hypothetical protein